MAAEDAALEAMSQRGVGDVLERAGVRIIRLVDMEVEVEAVRDRVAEDDVERPVELGDHVGDGAEEPAAVSFHRARHGAHMRLVERELDAEERARLDFDAAGPVCAQLRQYRPGDADLLAERIDMGAQRRRAVGPGAAQAELHPGPHVRR